MEFVQRPHPALAIGLHVIGEDRMGQHRDMAEHVVEDVRLLDIVELVGAADELAGGKAAVGEMVEEDLVGHQRRHRDHAPARQPVQIVRQPLEIRDVIAHQAEPLQPVQIFVAGAPRQHLGLPLIQRLPDRVLGGAIALPMLVNREIRPDVRMRFSQGFKTGHGRNRERAKAPVKPPRRNRFLLRVPRPARTSVAVRGFKNASQLQGLKSKVAAVRKGESPAHERVRIPRFRFP